MSQNEKLGIEIQIDLGKAKEQIDRLNGLIQKLGQSPDAAQKSFERLTEKMNTLARAFVDFDPDKKGAMKNAAKAIKNLMDEFGKSDDIEKFGKRLRKSEQDMDSHVAKFQKAQDEKVKALQKEQQQEEAAFRSETTRQYKKLEQEQQVNQRSLKAYATYIEQKKRMDAQAASVNELATFRSLGNQQVPTWGKGASRATQETLASDYMASLSKQGFTTWDNGSVQNTAALTKANRDAVAASRDAAREERERAKAHREAGSEANSAAKNTNVLNISLGKLATRITEFYSMRGVILGIGNEIRQAAQESLKFNQAIYDTGAISNASTEDMARFGKASLSIARNSKSTLNEINQMMNLLAQSGVSAENVPAVAKVVNMFASGTGSSMDNAVRVLTTTMNVWGYSAEDSAKAANVLAAGLNSAKIEVNELSTVFNYLAPMAKQVGMSLEETTGAVATLSQAGIKASTIGTSLSEMINKLMAPTPKLQKMFKDAGIGLDELNPRVNSLVDILNRVKEAGDALPMERVYSSFGPRAGRALEALLTLGPEYLKVMTDNVTGTQAAFTAYMTSMEGAMAKLNVLRQSFIQAFMDIASVTSGALEGAYKVIMDFLRGIQTEEGHTALALGAIALGVTGIVYALENLGKAWLVIKTMNPEVRLLMLAFAGVASAIEVFGNRANAVTASVDRAIKDYAKNASALQRTFTGLGDAYAKASEAGMLKNKMTMDAKTKIEQLVSAYPELLKYVREEVKTYGDLVNVMDMANKIRLAQAKQMLPTVNDLSSRITLQAKPYDDKIHRVERNIQDQKDFITDHKGEGGDQARAIITGLTEQRAKLLETRDKSVQFLQDKLDKLISSGGFKKVGVGSDGAAVYTIAESADVDLRKGNKPWVPPASSVKTPEERYEDRRSALYDKLERDTLALKEQSDSAYISSLKEMLKDKSLGNDDKKYILREIEVAVEAFYKDKLAHDEKAAKDEVDAFMRKDPKRATEDKAEIDKKLNAKLEGLRKANADQKSAALSGLDTLEDKTFPAEAMHLKSNLVEKAADKALQSEQQMLNLMKQEAWSGEQLHQLELQDTDAQIRNAAKKKAAYAEDLKQIELHGDLLKGDDQNYDAIQDKLDAIIGKERELVALKERQSAELSKQVEMGAKQAWSKASDLYSLSQGLGSDLVNQGFSGITGSISSAVSTFTLPDNEAINNIKSKINELNVQKAQIQSEIDGITSKGAFMTGDDKVKLTEKASGLEAINNQLKEQEKLLDKQQNAWTRFKDGLAETMKLIVKTLQEYIIKLLVVKMVESMLSLFSGGTAQTELNSPSGIVQPAFSGGDPNYFLPKATGGEIPLNAGVPGKDSVPILAMPGEFIIPTSSVNHYGVSFFESLRAKKFAEGGLVGGGLSPKGSSESDKKSNQSLTIVNVLPDQIPQTTDDQIINVISYDMAKKGQTYRAVRYATQG